MPLVPFNELLAEAERGNYAVGYFECWNLDSALAVAEAAEAARAPVLLGFSGIYLPRTEDSPQQTLATYAAFGAQICRNLSVPANLVFNESPHFDWVMEAIPLGFGLVMFTDEALSVEEQQEKVRQVVEQAHQAGVAVEGELTPLAGVSGGLSQIPEDLRLTDSEGARRFVECTGVDAFAVNIGQAHVHGRYEAPLDFARLAELKKTLRVPLVLHGASSVPASDLSKAAKLGIAKVNIGSVLKRTYFEALRHACVGVQGDYNPYEVMGSGCEKDVLAIAQDALRKKVEDLMKVLGSAARAR